MKTMTGSCQRGLFVLVVLTFAASAAADSFVIDARSVDRERQVAAELKIPVGQVDVRIDGRLDEAVWKSAAVIERFREYPARNPFSADARFRLLADERHVYVAFDVRHKPGDSPRFKEPKGGDEYGGSLIEVFLDPGAEGKERFQFICNPLGLRYDSRDADKQWNGKWKSAGQVRDDGWSVELAIPLSDLGRERVQSFDNWRANFCYVGPADLHLSWTGGWGSPAPDYADIVFTKTGADVRPNLLPDPGFETVTESGLPAGWHFSSRAEKSIAAADESSPRSGKKGLHLEFPQPAQSKGGNDIVAYRMVGPGFDGGQTYTYSCYVKTKGLEGSAYIAAFQYPAPFGPDHRHKSRELKGNQDWTRLSITFRAREDIQSLQVRCGVHASTPEKRGAVWFDDAKLELGDKATDFVPSAQPVLNVKRFAMWLDRDVYDLRDKTAVGLLELDADGIDRTDNLAVQLAVRDDKTNKNVITDRIEPLPGFRTDLTFDTGRFSPGKYRVFAQLVRNDGRVLATSERQFTKRSRRMLAHGTAAGRIPLRVSVRARADGVAWPVSSGVPFAQGVLTDTKHVRLLAPDGHEVPAQFTVRSTWNRRGSIQWLGVDFVPTLAKSEQEYVLEYGSISRNALASGSSQKPGASARRLSVEQTDDRIRVTTGPLQFSVGRKSFQLIDSAFLDANGNGKFEPAEKVVDASNSSGPALVDHEGTRYVAAADRDVEVVVEESGPVKTAIRATGWYVKEGTVGERLSCELPTDRLCRFTFRITAWAGQADVQIAASTVITYDSDKVRLRDLSLGLGLADVKKIQIGTDQPQGASPRLPGEPDASAFRLIGSDKDAVVWNATRLAESPHFVQHRWDEAFDDKGKRQPRAMGWITATGERTQTHVAVRNLSKMFPKEIEWTDNSLLLHVWPAHARERTFGLGEELDPQNIYKLWYAHQGRELDFRFPDVYFARLDEELRKSPGAFGTYYKAMEYSNAQGVCLHNDIVVGFRAKDGTSSQSRENSVESGPIRSLTTSATSEQLSSLLDNAVHAAPDPKYACATGVFGPILHADREKFGMIEDTVHDGFRSLAGRTEPNNEYGQLIFGGRHTYWFYHRQPPFAGVHRVWINGHYNIGRFPLIQYVRTGDPSYLHWSRNFTNNLRDIGMVHYTSDERRFRYHTLGAMYHCKGFAPWAGDSHVAAHLISHDQLIYDWCITGNQRSRDALLTWVEGVKQTSPGGYGTREGINTLSQLVEAYRFTWDAELLPIIDRFAVAIFRKQPLSEQHWWDYAPLLLPRYYGLTGSEECLDAYRTARRSDEPGTRGGRSALRGGSHIDGYLALLDVDRKTGTPARPEYNETGKSARPTLADTGLPDWQELLYQRAVSCVRQPDIPNNGHVKHQWLEFIYPAHKLPYILKAMDEFDLRLRRPDETPDAPLPTNNGRSIVYVRESKDAAFPVHLRFARVPSGPVTVKVTGSQGDVAAKQFTPTGDEPPQFEFKVPADNRADQYRIEIDYAGSYDAALWPLTSLPHESAALTRGQNKFAGSGLGTRLYLSLTDTAPKKIIVSSNSKRAMGMQFVDAKGRTLHRVSDSRYVGRPETVELKSVGDVRSLYVSDEAEVRIDEPAQWFVSPSSDRLFQPRLKLVSGTD
ncbi:MAG: hypothetical protein CMJ84_06365 [Planctomycetes bacterium]|nr:hypothetical protein [Planctomycetota bacterium]